MHPDTPTTEWPALREFREDQERVIYERWKQHKQHPVEHGAPRTRPELYLAAICVMKANRIWNNLLNGGTLEAVEDSTLDLSTWASFLGALIKEQKGDAKVKECSCVADGPDFPVHGTSRPGARAG